MLSNADKSNYMLITRAVGDYSARLQLNNNNLDRVKSVKLLGIWLTDPLGWELNTMEICKTAYARISILSKLKYVGMKQSIKPLSDVLSSTVVLYGTLLSQFTKTMSLNGYREFA